MRRSPPLLLALCLTGCAAGFVREGATPQQFYSDLQQCEQQANTGSSFCFGPWACSDMKHGIEHRRNVCMQAQGWTLTKSGDRFKP